MQLINLPMKPTATTTIDFSTNDSFIEYFMKSRGVSDRDKLVTVCGGLTAMRSQATSSRTLEKTTAGLQILSRYADQIAALIARTPSLENDILINFVWEGAFDKRGFFFRRRASTTQSLFKFEYFCVLFNIAVFQSQFAAEKFAESDQELENAGKWLQNAAGIFDYLATNVQTALPSQSCLTSDLQPKTLNTLSCLMLAQSQDIAIQKAIRSSKMKPDILAQVCAETEEMFVDCITRINNTSTTRWDKSWIANVVSKQLLYAGLAQFYQSQVASVNKNYGEQIARLTICIENLQKSQDKMKIDLCTQVLPEVKETLAKAKMENELIYYDKIPDPKLLIPIEKGDEARLVKANSVPHYFSSGFTDIFDQLEPRECPLQSPSAISAMQHTKEARLILPKTKNCGESLQDLREKLKQRLTNEVGGFTEIEGNGDWIDNHSGQVFNDEVWIYDFAACGTVLQEDMLTDIARWLREEAEQECIYLRLPGGNVIFV